MECYTVHDTKLVSHFVSLGDGKSPTNVALSCRILFDKFGENFPSEQVFHIKHGVSYVKTICDFSANSGAGGGCDNERCFF